MRTDLFAFKINYNDIADVNKRLYNGNISQTNWNSASINNTSNPESNQYLFEYDALNRITSAIGANTSNYNLNSVTYDKMGNILSLSRNGWQNTSTFTNKDVLTYSYYNSNVSNKLQKVLDNGNDNYGFKDGVNLTTEYTYDANANLITDANKGITSILYNHLNLPTEIKFNNNNDKKINYTYSADGAKLRKVVNDGGAITTLDYTSNGAVYENNTLQFIPHAEGYIIPNGSLWRYVYQYRDHIDNIRLSYSDGDGNGTISQSEIIQENNYQPFGLKMRGFNNNTNSLGNSMAERYMFGGKEFDDSFNETLNTYDFGARNYDPALGRWMNLDPLAEQMRRHSPYNYAFNNPIYFIDPDGMAPSDHWRLNSQNKLELIKPTDDNFNVFFDEDGKKLFQTNEVSDEIRKNDWLGKEDEYIEKISKVFLSIAKEPTVFSEMTARAEETGFDNSILKGGINEIKEIGKEQMLKAPAIAVLEGTIQVMKLATGNYYNGGGQLELIGEFAKGIYRSITGTNLVNDAKTYFKGFFGKEKNNVEKNKKDSKNKLNKDKKNK